MDDLVIEIDDQLLAELTRRAEAQGLDVGEYARRIIEEAMSERRD